MPLADLYDLMLETIQQFPLDANHFETEISRNNKRFQLLQKKYTRLLKGTPPADDPVLQKAHKKMKSCLKKHRRITETYREALTKHLKIIEDYNKINEAGVPIVPYSEVAVAAIRVSEEPRNKKRYCTCLMGASGIMIRCRNDDCPVKWYHLRCTELANLPTTEWYCQKCRLKLKSR